MENLFCKKSDLKNEASVESYFLDRLISELGYKDNEVSLKESISEFTVGKGSKKLLYKPDYIIKTSGIPTIVVDAKAPNQNIDDWVHQCSSYCLELNKEFDYNPVEYFILSNGLLTSLYKWDNKTELMKLQFEDFVSGSEIYNQFFSVLEREATKNLSETLLESLDSKKFTYKKVTLEELNNIFQKLHQEIWKAEKKSPAAAFHELIKIFFVKIRKDRAIHEKLGKNPKPKYKDVSFSSHWISTQNEAQNPINEILFKNLITELEKDILNGRKKRFFEKNDRINLSSGTLKKIVKEIENIDFYGMEEDIHGRMFEAFLEATIRGKDIGQFFTPRDIVNLMVELGDPKVSKTGADKILDACCGSGGFLIKSLSLMLQKADELKGLTSKEKGDLIEKIKLKSVYGIDAGSDPAMYKIARMNMYLHGDGGSNIYYADSLDKGIGRIGGEDLEVDKQIEELRSLVLEKAGKFDLILSNPPFSLQYTRDNKEQAHVLNQYALSRDRQAGKIINKLISSVMFIERYKDLVSDNGRIIAVIDDSVLSGSSYQHVRNYIRENFIIDAVISLPGDAFKRASARVKTSIIILKKKVENESQQDIFLASTVYLGLEDKIARRIGITSKDLEESKRSEMSAIVHAYRGYKQGHDNDFVYPFTNCLDRLDVKHCVHDKGRKVEYWKSLGYRVSSLGNILKPVNGRSIKVEEETEYQLLVVNYGGEIEKGEILDGSESSYSKLYQVHAWDILISNMGFGRGAISVVPPYHSGKYVSNEYTILKAPSHESAIFYWNLLRTKEILGDVFSSTTGMNRGRIKWDIISEVLVPEYDENEEIVKLTEEIKKFWESNETFMRSKDILVQRVSKELDVVGDDSLKRWLSYKPPE